MRELRRGARQSDWQRTHHRESRVDVGSEADAACTTTSSRSCPPSQAIAAAPRRAERLVRQAAQAVAGQALQQDPAAVAAVVRRRRAPRLARGGGGARGGDAVGVELPDALRRPAERRGVGVSSRTEPRVRCAGRVPHTRVCGVRVSPYSAAPRPERPPGAATSFTSYLDVTSEVREALASAAPSLPGAPPRALVENRSAMNNGLQTERAHMGVFSTTSYISIGDPCAAQFFLATACRIAQPPPTAPIPNRSASPRPPGTRRSRRATTA